MGHPRGVTRRFTACSELPPPRARRALPQARQPLDTAPWPSLVSEAGSSGSRRATEAHPFGGREQGAKCSFEHVGLAKNDRTPWPIRPISHEFGWKPTAPRRASLLSCLCLGVFIYPVLADDQLHERQASAQARAEDGRAYQGYVRSLPTVIGASDRAELLAKLAGLREKGLLSEKEFASQTR